MVERKRGASDAGAAYVGIARSLLASLKQSMALNKLLVLSRTVDLPDGVRITVSSMFGQDDINIDISALATQQGAGAADIPPNPRDAELVPGRLGDSLSMSAVIYITITEPAPVAPAPTPAPAPGAALPSLYIAGYRTRTWYGGSASVPFVWNDVDGMRNLSTRTFENDASVTALSKNGQWAVGSGTLPPVAGDTYQGSTTSAARWGTNGSGSTRSANTAPNGGTFHYIAATGVDSNGTTITVNCAGAAGDPQTKNQWGGGDNRAVSPGNPSVDSNSSLSHDGLVASGGDYWLDNGPRQAFGGSDCHALCVVRIRRATAPQAPPPVAPPLGAPSSTLLVFSG